MNKTAVPFAHSTARLLRRRTLLLTALACVSVSPALIAGLNPPPDGGYPKGNTAEGTGALDSLTTGKGNTAAGFNALTLSTTGNFNTAGGVEALFQNTTGNYNTASGSAALDKNSSGSYNTAIGTGALYFNTTGLNNIALGYLAGGNLDTGSGNIAIGNFNPGTATSTDVAGEANTIRIGHPAVQTAAFIAGISGVSVANSLPVVIDGNGQLGTASAGSLTTTVLDGNNNVIGRLVTMLSGGINAGFWIRTNNGYFAQVSENGAIGNGVTEYYTTTDCSGTAYLPTGSTAYAQKQLWVGRYSPNKAYINTAQAAVAGLVFQSTYVYDYNSNSCVCDPVNFSVEGLPLVPVDFATDFGWNVTVVTNSANQTQFYLAPPLQFQ